MHGCWPGDACGSGSPWSVPSITILRVRAGGDHIMDKDFSRSLGVSHPKNRLLLSRTATSLTDRVSDLDAQSVPTVDQLSAARASVNMSDKLWTQIDVLDDVRAMAQEVERSGSFFNDEFSARLMELKETQSGLMEKVLRHQEESERAREIRKRHSWQNYENQEKVGTDEERLAKEQEYTRQRMAEFFSSSSKGSVDLEQMRNFNNLKEYVAEVKHSLSEVGDKMQAFDGTKKKLW